MVRGERRSDQLEPGDAEIRGHAHGGSEVPGLGGFNEDQ